MTEPRRNTQTAPFPVELEELVSRLRYRPGWRVALSDIERDPADTHGTAAGGLTLIVTTSTINSYRQEQMVRVNHYFPVPAATYNEASWLRWLFDCMAKVELHECMEFFALTDTVVNPDDQCVLCGHAAQRHDGRNNTCSTPKCAAHRFRGGEPTLLRPFAPTHGPGDDPYVVHEYADDVQRRTSFRGEVNT